MSIIHINESRFQVKSLFGSKVINRNAIAIVIIHSIRAENATNDMIRGER